MSTQRVVIIDDEQDNVHFVSEILSEMPLETVSFTDASLALEDMNLKRPALVICDVQMPVLNGFQVLKAMGEEKELKDVPVIFLSAIGAVTGEDFDPDLIEKKYGVRPRSFVPKPINPKKVIEAVQSVLKVD